MQLPHPCLTLSKVHRPTPVRSSQNRGIPWAPWIRRQLPRSLWTFQGHFEQPLGTWQNRAASDRLLLKCFKSKRWTRWHEGQWSESDWRLVETNWHEGQWSESDWRLVETNPCLLHGSKHGPYSFGFAAKSKSPKQLSKPAPPCPLWAGLCNRLELKRLGRLGRLGQQEPGHAAIMKNQNSALSFNRPTPSCMHDGRVWHILPHHNQPEAWEIVRYEHRKDCSKRTGLAIAAHSQSSTAPNNEVSLQSHHVRKLSRLN